MWKAKLVAAVAAAGAACLLAGAASAESPVDRGAYLATIMDCTGCHTGGALTGRPDAARFLAGSEVGFALPGLGVFYPPNLTPDPETGLGEWSEEEIITAIRAGERPDGRVLAPIMPWPSYAELTDADAKAVAAYLKSLEPVRFEVPEPIGPDQEARHPYLSLTVPE